ncbi:hypothetical protein A3SI_01611 [Nitritalea halalkaliphila LW7]|uniref:Uncharacterized protein n=1 Tax=Nitritalea halalkaliphila LW7 TaxID=1189621 RepID=I5CA76_9BACT|nr:hypothetical protein [Nitritalea halalkaliphila]EIM78728.1 hypothetical protein A3SI_01611 [Nitritalea halalkaliphila LW7]
MERRDKAFYQELYREWLSSGLKKSVFAANRGINRTTFYYWCKKLEVVSEPISEPFTSFKRLAALAPAIEQQPFLKVTLPNGIRVTFYEEISTEHLKRLLAC